MPEGQRGRRCRTYVRRRGCLLRRTRYRFVILRSEATKNLTAQTFYCLHCYCQGWCCKILHFVQNDRSGILPRPATTSQSASQPAPLTQGSCRTYVRRRGCLLRRTRYRFVILRSEATKNDKPDSPCPFAQISASDFSSSCKFCRTMPLCIDKAAEI